MYLFASRNSAPDAARRSAAYGIVGLWIVPLGLLSLWFLAGGFTVASLASATAAWRTRPVPVEVRQEPAHIALPVSPPLVHATRRCKLARPAPARPARVL